MSDSNVGISRRRMLGGVGALALAGAVGMTLGGCSGAARTSGGATSSPADAAGSSAGDGEAPSSSHADSSSSADQLVSRVFFAFDTLVTIKGAGITDEMFDSIASELQRFDALFSAHKDDSDIGRINAAGGAPVQVDPDTADLISRSLEVCDLFDGDFDITIGSVSLLWDFVEGVKPSDEAIAQGVAHVDYHGVRVDGTTVTLDDPDAKLDLGGIAKGWIAGRLDEMLGSWGVEHADIDLGSSSIYLRGAKPDGSDWRLGLRDPANPEGSSLGVIEASDAAVVTSGLYDQHFVLDGVDYYHILDPRTGYPAQTDMAALTAVLGDSLLGDGLTTAFFIRGVQGSLDWISQHPERGVEAVFIGDDDRLTFTDGFVDDYGFESARPASSSADAGASAAEG